MPSTAPRQPIDTRMPGERRRQGPIWWTGLGSTVMAMALAAFAVSIFRHSFLYAGPYTVGLARGGIEVTIWPTDWMDRYGVRPAYGWRTWTPVDEPDGDPATPVLWLPMSGARAWGRQFFFVPLWIILIAALAPIAVTFRGRTLAERGGPYRYARRGSRAGRPECDRSSAGHAAAGELPPDL